MLVWSKSTPPHERLTRKLPNAIISLAKMSSFCARRIVFLTIVAMVGVAAEARATTYCGPAPPCLAFTQASEIFAGRVRAIETGHQDGSNVYDRIRFEVRETFRGHQTRTVDVDDKYSLAWLRGYTFEVGHSYLVYAQRGEGASLAIVPCARTRPLETAALDLLYLRELQRQGSATVTGVVQNGDPSYPIPLRRTPIALTCGNRVYRTRSDNDGQFHFFRVAPAGALCQVRPEIAEDHYLDDPGWFDRLPDEVPFPSGRTCGDVQLTVKSNGRIRGRVVDAAGMPVSDLIVDVWRAPRNFEYQIASASPRTNSNGEFEANHLEPGEYLMGVNSRTDVRQRFAFGTAAYFPGVAAAGGATAVAVDAGQRIDIASTPFVLPANVRLTRVTGVAVRENGQPAAGAEVLVWTGIQRQDGALLIGSFITNASGRFAVALPRDATGWFEVRWPSKSKGFRLAEVGTADFVVGPGHDLQILLSPVSPR